MAQGFFNLNRDMLHTRAHEAKQRAESFGGEGDLKWYDWKPGENVFRFFPPLSAKGLVFREVYRHYDIPEINSGNPDQNQRSGPKNPMCLGQTFTDVSGMQCPFCMVLEYVSQQFPQMDLSEYKPSRQGYAWILDKKDLQAGPQIARFPPGVMDWVEIQLDNVEWDILNLQAGVDIHVTRTGAGKKGTKYSQTLSPARSPLAPSDEWLQYWASKMKDLDEIFIVPTGSDADMYTARAQAFYDFLLKKVESAQLAQHSFGNPGLGLPQAMPAHQPPPPAPLNSGGYPVGPRGPVPTAPGVPPPTPMMAPPQQPMAPVAQPPAPQQLPTQVFQPPAMPTPQPMQTPQAPVNPFAGWTSGPPAQGAPVAASPPANLSFLQPGAPALPAQPPMGQPPAPGGALPASPLGWTPQPAGVQQPGAVKQRKACFGGAAPHPDGRWGYQPDLPTCSTCDEEFTCVDACAARQGVKR